MAGRKEEGRRRGGEEVVNGSAGSDVTPPVDDVCLKCEMCVRAPPNVSAIVDLLLFPEITTTAVDHVTPDAASTSSGSVRAALKKRRDRSRHPF